MSSETWQAERALLGGLMLDPAALGAVAQLVSPSDFGDDEHGDLFAAMLKLNDGGIAPEPEALMTALNGNADPALVMALFRDGIGTANAHHYAKSIRLGGIRRRLRAFGERLASDTSDTETASLIEMAMLELETLAGDGPQAESRPPTRAALTPSEDEIGAAKLAPRCIVDQYLYADVAQLVAPGSTGKTTMLLHEAACIALGAPVWGCRVEGKGWTLVVTAEDQRERLIARLREITASMGLTDEQRRHVFGSVIFWDVTGSAVKLTGFVDGNLSLTRLADDLVRAHKDDPPAVVVFDPLVSFGASEQAVNDNEQALVTAGRRIVRGLECCVRFIHHTGKANARAATLDQYSGRGGSALADGSRMTTVLQRYTPDDEAGQRPPPGCKPDPDSSITILARAKLSYSPPNLPNIWIKRTGFEFEYFAELRQTPDEAAAAKADQLERYLVSQFKQGRHWTARTLEDGREHGMTKRELRAALAELRASGRVVDMPLPKDKRQGSRQSFICPSNCAASVSEGGAVGNF